MFDSVVTWETPPSESATDGAVLDSETPSETSPAEQLFYQYSTIDSAKRAFRLLILRGGTGQDIDCELVESTIDGKGLPYEAVSYTWGPNFTAGTVNINGKKLPVTFNLSLILRDLRFTDADRVIWVDAICINQQDAIEKGHQVAQMQNIYALAERVLFCIARPTNYTELFLSSLEKLQSEIQNSDLSDNSHIDACWRKTQTTIARNHLIPQPQPSNEALLSVQLEALIFLQRQGLEWILGQPWFHRVWILQEVANARDALVYCGRKSVSAAIFAVGARLLGYSLPDERRKTVDEVLNLMPARVRNGERRDVESGSQDLLSLFRRFGKANASVERDRIYALFGMCEDKQIQTHISPNYIKSERKVLIDTIAYICHCKISVIKTIPYRSIALFLSDVGSFDNTLLSHFLRSMNYKGALSILKRRGQAISVTLDILNMAVNNTMMKEGVMSHLLEQRNVKTLLSGQEGSGPLRFAAKHGYDTIVRQMLEKGADINPPDYEDRGEWRVDKPPPLTLAAMNGHTAVVKILLEKGATQSSKSKGAPLTWAARNGHISIVELLVEKGSNIKHYGLMNSMPLAASEETPLTWAARNGHSSIVELLVEKGSDVEHDGLDGRSPLSWAASEGHEAIVRFLYRRGADPKRTEYLRDHTPLSRAAENGHSVIVQILLKDSATFYQSTKGFALICAAKAAQKSAVGLLLDVDTGIDLLDLLDLMVAKNWERDDRREDFEAVIMLLFAKGAHFHKKSTPLLTAAAAGNERAVRLFLDYGAKLDYMGTPGTRLINKFEKDYTRTHLFDSFSFLYSGTALTYAIHYGHKDLAELLLAKDAHLEARDGDKRTPLMVAAIRGHESIVRMLLQKGADIGARDRHEQPVYVGAVPHWNIVKLLLEEGPDIAVRECDGKPLLCAAEAGRGDIVEILLEKGADPDLRDQDNRTPLSYAAEGGHVDVVKMLLAKGADPDLKDQDKKTPLSHAAKSHYRVDTVKVLLESGADIEARDSNGRTPLCLAADSRAVKIMRVLLENGANMEVRDDANQTPLELASSANYDHNDAVGLLVENGAHFEAEDRWKYVPFRSIGSFNEEYLRFESAADLDVDGTEVEQIPSFWDTFSFENGADYTSM